MRPAGIWCMGLWCMAALLSAACQRNAVEWSSGVTLHVQFQTPNGLAVRGGWVQSAQGKQLAPEGSVEVVLPFHAQGQGVAVECPLLYSGGTTQRDFSATTLSAGGKLEMTMLCRPMQRAWGLSVRSECKDAQLFLEDHALGRVRDGWFHAWITHEQRGTAAALDRSLRLRAQADPSCKFIDPLTRRLTSNVELTLTLASSAQALWAHFSGVTPARAAPRTNKKPARRPYRL